jgi:hypothetical protein
MDTPHQEDTVTNTPAVVDTLHFMDTGQRLDLTQPGPWTLTGFDSSARMRDITTTHEGPIDQAARSLLSAAYPYVSTWNASPARVDETYTDSRKAAYRICQLLGVELATARAIQTIAADPVLGFKYTHGQWEVTGDDDDQSFRIRSVKPASYKVSGAAHKAPWEHAPGEGLEGAVG